MAADIAPSIISMYLTLPQKKLSLQILIAMRKHKTSFVSFTV
jgi:hypothetical protein